MMNKILIAITVALLISAFIGGCQYGKHRCGVKYITRTTTTTVYDTITKHIKGDSIPFPVKPDAIVYNTVEYKYHDVDTAAILKDYYAKHVYSRSFSNVDLLVNWTDTISQNSYHPGATFSYTILRPTEIINTTVEQVNVLDSRILFVGVTIPMYPLPIDGKIYPSYDIRLVKDLGYLGFEYNPYYKTVGLQLGVRLFDW